MGTADIHLDTLPVPAQAAGPSDAVLEPSVSAVIAQADPATTASVAVRIPSGRMDALDRALMVIVSLILALLAGLMITSLSHQWSKYNEAIDVALGSREPAQLPNAARTGPDHAAALTYARALDEASIKMSALMLAFVLVFLGALYVLRTTTSAFHLGINNAPAGQSGTLETSSPGLVMVTLGLVLVAIAVLHRTDIDYQGPTLEVPAQVQPDTNQSPPAQSGLPLENPAAGAQGGSHS